MFCYHYINLQVTTLEFDSWKNENEALEKIRKVWRSMGQPGCLGIFNYQGWCIFESVVCRSCHHIHNCCTNHDKTASCRGNPWYRNYKPSWTIINNYTPLSTSIQATLGWFGWFIQATMQELPSPPSPHRWWWRRQVPLPPSRVDSQKSSGTRTTWEIWMLICYMIRWSWNFELYSRTTQ